jgi:hypothetical protein
MFGQLNPEQSAKMSSSNQVIERSSIVAYSLLSELHACLADPKSPDDVTLGLIMGLAMFLDDKVGPVRAQNLMKSAPGIVLKTDAHVTESMARRFDPVLRAFGEQLVEMTVPDRKSVVR